MHLLIDGIPVVVLIGVIDYRKHAGKDTALSRDKHEERDTKRMFQNRRYVKSTAGAPPPFCLRSVCTYVDNSGNWICVV